MIEWLLYLLLLVLGFPTGLFLFYLCREEVSNWKFRFKIISWVCIIGVVGLLFVDYKYKVPVIFTLLFIFIVNYVLIKKGVSG